MVPDLAAYRCEESDILVSIILAEVKMRASRRKSVVSNRAHQAAPVLGLMMRANSPCVRRYLFNDSIMCGRAYPKVKGVLAHSSFEKKIEDADFQNEENARPLVDMWAEMSGSP